MGQKKRKYIDESQNKACIFCGDAEENEEIFGKFYHKKDLSVHQNCMFFSSGLAQRGSRESDGILGFLIKDIKDEYTRGQKLKCCFCKTNGATIGCVVNNCRKTFHFPCGTRNHVLSQHFGNFACYCHTHKPKQKTIKLKSELYCHICCNTIAKEDINDCLYSPCCKNDWFHKCCLQKYALSAGRHFFKCPLCNDSSKFVNDMQTFGICIPDKDAAWELETNAFGELLYRPECGALTCSCRSGRKYDGEGLWELLVCEDCGADARHRQCEDISNCDKTWLCNDCKAFETAKQKDINLSTLNKTVNISNDTDIMEPLPVLTLVEPSCSHTSRVSESIDDVEPPKLTLEEELDSSGCLPHSNKIENNTIDKDPSHLLPNKEAIDKNFKNSVEIKKVKNKTIKDDIDIAVFDQNSKDGVENKKVNDSKILKETLEKSIIDQNSNGSVEIKKVKDSKTFSVKNNFLKDSNSLEADSCVKNFCLLFNNKTLKKDSPKASLKQKRRKTFNMGCCSGNSQCIRKMLGFGCQNYKG